MLGSFLKIAIILANATTTPGSTPPENAGAVTTPPTSAAPKTKAAPKQKAPTVSSIGLEVYIKCCEEWLPLLYAKDRIDQAGETPSPTTMQNYPNPFTQDELTSMCTILGGGAVPKGGFQITSTLPSSTNVTSRLDLQNIPLVPPSVVRGIDGKCTAASSKPPAHK